MSKVSSIGAHDDTGVKKNISDILELLANKELGCVIIAWQTKDEFERVFWNGDSLKCRGLASQVLADMTYLHSSDVEGEITYDRNLDDD